MSDTQSTCWLLIDGAATGNAADRSSFAARYAGPIRAYLAARWQGRAIRQELDDAVQEVFVECFRSGGILERSDASQAGGFRAFLYGAVRNVALRVETRRARQARREDADHSIIDELPQDEESYTRVFDRAWATSVMRQAAGRLRERSLQAGPDAVRRVDLLHLRFHEGLPIREISRRWNEDPARLHHAYAQVRREFHDALVEVMRFYHPDSLAETESACKELLSLLGRT